MAKVTLIDYNNKTGLVDSINWPQLEKLYVTALKKKQNKQAINEAELIGLVAVLVRDKLIEDKLDGRLDEKYLRDL